MNEHDDLTRRLAELGRHDVDPAVATRHLAALDTATPAPVRSRRLRPVAAAAAAAVVMAGAGVAAAALGGGGARPTVVAEAPALPDAAAVDETPADPPDDVPPVEVPDEATPATDEAEAEVEVEGDGPGRAIAEARRMLRDARREAGCTGPPPWAGTPAGPGGRGEEARAHAATRATCGDPDLPADADPSGPPPGVPPSEPSPGPDAEEVPAGPPADVPPADQPPADVPPVAGVDDGAGAPEIDESGVSGPAVIDSATAGDRAPLGAIGD